MKNSSSFRIMTGLRALLGAGAALLASTAASAQLPQPSAAGLGMGDNYTAVARGFSAVAWNPANLGLSGNPRGSFALLGVGAVGGLGPVSPADVAQYDGQLISDEVKGEWLSRIQAEGGEKGSAGVDVTLVALSAWRFGFHLGSTVQTVGNLAPDAVELLLFGNAGVTGEPRAYSTRGSTIDLVASSTGALSYAHPIQLGGGGRLAVGATAKYTVGHGLFTGQDAGSEFSTEPLGARMHFPVIQNDTVMDANVGGGWGLDLGASWEQSNWSAGVTVRNVVNTFAWDESKLVLNPGRASFDADTTVTDFDLRPLSEAPPQLRERLDELTYSPVLSAGVAYRPSRRVLVSADARTATGDGLHVGPKSQIGVGTELRLIPFVPLRAGVSMVSGGYKLSAGLGLEVGPLRLTAGGNVREDEFGSGSSGMFILSLGGR